MPTGIKQKINILHTIVLAFIFTLIDPIVNHAFIENAFYLKNSHSVFSRYSVSLFFVVLFINTVVFLFVKHKDTFAIKETDSIQEIPKLIYEHFMNMNIRFSNIFALGCWVITFFIFAFEYKNILPDMASVWFVHRFVALYFSISIGLSLIKKG